MATPSDGAARFIHPRPSPGAAAVDKAERDAWWQAYLDKGDDYAPRTKYLDDDGRPEFVNRLILAESPYLIQHAHNPVDWHPWGDGAFEKARREDKPVFLSIGYSTCHWCHVMEEESFDDVEVARYLNEHFVAIKVDRERRPDVDDIYMTAVQLLTGGGGWPMSTWLTADGEPFFGGTYYPRESFLELLQRITQAWAEQRPQITAQAARIAATIRQHTTAAGEAAEIGTAEVTRAVDQILARHDDRLGGFSGAPKFPHEPELLLLLDQVLRSGDPAVMTALNITLDHMARGGIYDQVGGGFHRYATDVNWLVPHFEKMLYNQAHLARAYLEAWTITGDPMHERVARQTLDYVLRDMTSADGGFYSATDADSEGEEGLFFVWTPEQIRQALPEEDAELAIELFGITEAGNFEGRNILTLPQPLPAFAAARNLPFDELLARVDAIRERLYGVREQRPHPLRDDKLVTAWNGMMITALARAAAVLDDERYLGAAERAGDFLWQHSRGDDGHLWRVYLDGRASLAGNLEDYAYLAEACLALSEISDDDHWLRRAGELADAMLANFWDDDGGGFFLSVAEADGPMLARPKSPEDGAIPSGNSVAVRVLANLAQRTGEDNYRHHAKAALAAFGGRIQQSPPAFSYMLRGAAELLEGSAGPVQYAARGTVRAAAQVNDNGEFTVTVTTAPGWHINAHEPLDEYLIPTALAPAPESAGRYGLEELQYPDAEVVELGFQDTPLAVYQGRVEIQGRLAAVESRAPAIVNLRLTVQACDDEKCLAPEHPTLNLPWPNTTLEP